MISWEGQPIWLITAYFPNALEGTKATIMALRNILRTIKGKRVILAGDFNSTETLSFFDTGGPKRPSKAKEPNAESVQELLNEWKFKDLWTKESNKAREVERPQLDHLTHWNHDHTRGVCIDRVYTNFVINADVEVTTHYHIGSDHKGVKYFWSCSQGHVETPLQAPTQSPLSKEGHRIQQGDPLGIRKRGPGRTKYLPNGTKPKGSSIHIP
jgi:hypothetical protein